MEQTLHGYSVNPLYRYISTVFGKEETERLFALYKVGTSKKWGGSTIFWQIDVNGNVRTGKIMKYDDKTGHRIKESHSLMTWVHSELKLSDFTLRQCFFGEHLLNVVSFIVHLDELNPHAHAVIVPITKDGRLSAKDMFGGNDMNQARTRMRELHSRLTEVNEKYGLERGDDITITGAKHKSTETYRRELADECRTLSNEVGMKKTLLSGLNRSITKAETRIKALQTMVNNLEKAEADNQATIAELEDYMKNHLGDAVEIKAKITATRKELWDVRDKLNEKKMKLEQAKLQLDELQKNTSYIEARNRDIKADFEKTAVSYQQQMINKIWAQAGMKALAEIADIYPRMTSIHDSSLFDNSFAMDFINHGDKIIYCAMYLYVGYINEATNFAESQGGGGSDAKDWGRDKDEDEIEWIRRCLRQATKMMKPMKRKGLSR